MGHVELSIADIEFVGGDEITLDDDDVVLLDERRPARERARASAPVRRAVPLPGPYSRVFDDAHTRVWSRAAAVGTR